MIVHLRGNAVDDIRQLKASTYTLDIIDRIWSKQPLKDTCDQINHHDAPLLPEHHRKLAKYLHRLRIDDQLRDLADGRALRLHMLPEACGELEYGMGGDVRRDVLVSLLLVADVDETVVHAHFELRRRLVAAALVLVEFFQALEGCGRDA